MTQKEFATAFNKQMIEMAKSMYNMILKDGYKLHHTALAKGYQTRKYDSFQEYSGKFGTGYKVLSNNPHSNNFCFVTYYVK